MHPIPCFAFVYCCMLALARRHPCIFGKYTDWIRVQLFFWATLCSENAWTESLIWTNAVGCYFAIQGIYCLTEYRLLDELAARFFRDNFGFQSSSRAAHVLADALVHGLPVLFALGQRTQAPPFRFAWILTSVPHATYAYWVLGSWDPAPLYRLPPTPKHLVPWIWACVVTGHALAQFILV